MAGLTGGPTLKVGGDNFLRLEENFPVAPDRAYGFRFRFRQNTDPTSGTKLCYAGLVFIKSDGTTGMDIDGTTVDLTSGTACRAASFAWAVNGVSEVAGDGWHTFTAYWQGLADEGVSGTIGSTASYPGKFHADTRYVRIVFGCNVGGTDGEAEIDALELYDATTEIRAMAAVGSSSTASSAYTLAGSKTAVFYSNSPPTNPTSGYTLRDGDVWYNKDTTTNCPDSNCLGHTTDSYGVPLVGSYPHRSIYWAHTWSGTDWLDAKGERLIIAQEIAVGAMVADKIGANEVTVDKLTAGSLSLNLFPNGTSEATQPATADTSTSEWSNIVPHDAYTGTNCRYLSNLSDEAQLAVTVPCVPGDSFVCRAMTKMTASTYSTSDSRAGVNVVFKDASGTILAPSPGGTAYVSGPADSTYAQTTSWGTAPATAVSAYLYVFAHYCSAYFDGIVFQRMVDGPVLNPAAVQTLRLQRCGDSTSKTAGAWSYFDWPVAFPDADYAVLVTPKAYGANTETPLVLSTSRTATTVGVYVCPVVSPFSWTYIDVDILGLRLT